MFANPRKILIGLALLAIALAAPAFVYPVLLMKVLCFALFASAFNLLLGFAGILSFGHAMFFGSAAYVSAQTIKVLGWPTELGILAGGAIAAVLGLVVGALCIRRKGIYMTMITLAFAQMLFFVFMSAPFTGGENGLQPVPRRAILGMIDISNDRVLYYVVLAIFLAGFGLIYRVIHSPFGQVLKAIRDNEPRAISLGYDVDRFKLIAFVLSAGLSGIAGATKAVIFQLASLTDVHWGMSGEVILMTLVGGIGSIFGPLLGAAFIVGMQNQLAGLGEWVLVVQGLIFMTLVMVLRAGIMGLMSDLSRWVSKLRASR
ncbi:branched-chain amino acid ABC transporter permease [Hoeflea olei]|uniref:ABC transporter permease n=1 Tax=Hoeflea olei TaxID=1480615 RepID=A0A1C1YYG8_9HYPH|nr:branched-chain amino acid ABC transporter permease [Hoeflea olei]OCW58522.1 ABC transporter permease [Hoeflea olei]